MEPRSGGVMSFFGPAVGFCGGLDERKASASRALTGLSKESLTL